MRSKKIITAIMTAAILTGCGAAENTPEPAPDTVPTSDTVTEEATGSEWNEYVLFKHGLLPVEVDDLYGYVNESGEFVIEPQFEFAFDFDEYGYAEIKLNGKTGWINTEGEIVGYFPYEFLTGYSEKGEFGENGLMPVWGIADMDHTDGFVNRSGELVISGVSLIADSFYPFYPFERCKFSEDGLAPAGIDGKYGYIDNTGSFVIEPQFEYAGNFDSEGMAKVKINGKVGFIDKTGAYVIEPQFDYAEHFYSNNCTHVSTGDRYMIINRKGEIISEGVDGIDLFGYTFEFPPYGLKKVGNCIFDGSERRYGYIDNTGKIVIEPQFNNAYEFSDCGLARVQFDNKWGFIDETGKTVIEPKFDYADDFSADGIAAVKIDDLWGFIDDKGNYIAEPQFDAVYNFFNGLAAVGIFEDGHYKWGCIDTSGETVIDMQFSNAMSFYDDGYAIVTKDGQLTVINTSGENILPEGCSPSLFYRAEH